MRCLSDLFGAFVNHALGLAHQGAGNALKVHHRDAGGHAHIGLDALLQFGLTTPAGLVVVGGGIDRENPASPADRHIPFTANLVHQKVSAASATASLVTYRHGR